MLAIYGAISIASGTCVACGGTKSRFEQHSDRLGGLLLVAGLFMIGAMLPMPH